MIRATTFVVSSPLTVAAYRDTHHKVRCVVAVNVAAYRDTRHNVGSVVAINGSAVSWYVPQHSLCRRH